MDADVREKNDPFTTVVLGLLIPGGGHLYGGRFGKALFFFTLVVGTFLAGLILSDFHAVSLKHQPYWFLGQAFNGLPAFASVFLSPDWKSIRIGTGLEAGTLYTTVAGLLNILVILDAVFPAELRLLFNVRDEGQARDPQALFETVKSTPGFTGVFADFASMTAGLKALRSLSFARTGSDRNAFPRDMQCGLFKTSSGAKVVFGGDLSEVQRAELASEFKKRAREVTIAIPGGEEETTKRSWWKLL